MAYLVRKHGFKHGEQISARRTKQEEEKNSVSYNTTNTVGTTEGGMRNDTATSQNTVSAGEVTNISENEQGNPINDDGSLNIDIIESIDELTDDDFNNPSRNVQLPALPKNVDEAIGANGKPVIIKKNIFEKNLKNHKFSSDESRKILKSALYNTDLVGQTQPTKKPLHWVAIKLDNKSPIVVLEVNENKDNTEIVGWYTLDERNLERIKRQANKNGGELIVLSPKDKVESLSTPLDELSSADKVTNTPDNEQGETEKKDENESEIKESRVVGGNSGYVGYSMSKRAAQARDEGRFPKTDFKKVYGLSDRAFDMLVRAGIIDDSEWHHTSKFGNKTTFYSWAEDVYAEIYAANKKEFDAIAKKYNLKNQFESPEVSYGKLPHEYRIEYRKLDNDRWKERNALREEYKGVEDGPRREEYLEKDRQITEKYDSMEKEIQKKYPEYAAYKENEDNWRNRADEISRDRKKMIEEVRSLMNEKERDMALRDAVIELLQQSGIEVVTNEEAQRVLDWVNGEERLQAKKRALETASLDSESRSLTVVTSAEGAKILKSIEKEIQVLENSATQPKTFIGDVAKVLGAKRHNSKSEYATFETKNGRIVTIRLADHNSTVSNFDNHGELNGISIVISPKGNKGINNDGNAHVVEYYYDAIKLRRADGKPLVDIVRSIQQALYSGEFNDTTGLAERQEVNEDYIREQRVYHGSGADFDAFDHSHMGEGEGAQAYGWGTYVTEVDGIGISYAKNSKRASGLRRSELEFNLKRAKERLPFVKGDAKKELEAEIRNLESQLENLNEAAILYTVEIPKDDGINYLHWEEPIPDTLRDKLMERIPEIEANRYELFEYRGHDYFVAELKYDILDAKNGEDLLDVLEIILGPEKTSQLLSSLGYTGISYPAEYRSGRREDSARNYVIFNESDAKIVDKIRLFKTPSGHAYGFTVDGKIYVDKKIAGSETPIHEYSHLWAAAMRQVNPEEWKNIVNLMKGTTLWEEVKKMYPELTTDDDIADEVLAHYSGKRGAERLKKAQEEAMKQEGLFDKAAALSAIYRVKEALNRFWKGVADFLGVHFTSAEEVADKVLSDLLNGVNPANVAKNGEVKYEQNSEEADIVARAKADGTYMKAPNGKPTNLTPRQWVQVRTKAFKEWFGDWEKAARIEKLRKSKDASITGNEIEITDDDKQNKKNALEYGKMLQGEYRNSDTGMSIQIQRGRKNGGIKEVLQHNYKDIPHILSIAAIPQIIENSIYIESDPNNDIAKNPNVVEYQHFVCGLKIGTDDYTVHSLVAVDKFGNRYYDHNLTHIEKTNLLDQVEGQAVNGQGFDTTSGTKPTTLSGYKGKQLLELLQTNSSKVVDENGEPMVVYHGTRSNLVEGKAFTKFSDKKINFFTDNSDVAEYYGGMKNEREEWRGVVYKTFLNFKKPLVVNAKGSSWYNISFDGRKMDTVDIGRYAFGKGYDGVIIKNINEIYEKGTDYLSFEPTQIKSATDNIGTFDPNNPDIRYQLSTAEHDLEAVNERFNNELERYKNREMASSEMLHLGNPRGVMRKFLPNIPIVMRQRILNKGAVKKHNVDISSLSDMPQYLSSPIFVFQRNDNTLGVLTEMKDRDGKNVCVAIEINRQIQDGGDILEVNDIRSVHGRNIADIIYPIINNETLKWVDKEKGLSYLSSASRYVQQEIDKKDLISATKVVKEFKNPSIEEDKNDLKDEILTRAGSETEAISGKESVKSPQKPIYTEAQKEGFVKQEKRRVSDAAREMAARLGIEDDVEFIETNEGLTGREATAKGWFKKNLRRELKKGNLIDNLNGMAKSVAENQNAS